MRENQREGNEGEEIFTVSGQRQKQILDCIQNTRIGLDWIGLDYSFQSFFSHFLSRFFLSLSFFL